MHLSNVSKLIKFSILSLCLLVLATYSTYAKSDKPKLNIVTTTSMIADAVQYIGGKHVTVTALMGPGIDPHAYRQTRTDIAKLVRADLVLWHGLYLEAQMEEFFAALSKRKKVIAVGNRIDKTKLLAHDDYKDRFDPHIWMNPDLWIDITSIIKNILVETDPANAADYKTNAKQYLNKIAKLSAYAKKTLASIPANQRFLITAHDAFNYFGQAYNFEVIGIQGISTESEASLRRIEDLIDHIVKNKISSIFVETSVADRNIKALIEGAAAKGHKVTIGGEIFSDAMGKAGTYEGTYIGMIDHNATLIARALGGTAPERGMQNRLGGGH
ncbi:MAG: zinc ABC transporter substrate-binding protein [Pseudomonadota bacterium]